MAVSLRNSHLIHTATTLHSPAEYLQRTLSNSVSFEGIGVHNGQPVRMIVHPSGVDSGYVFIRTDLISQGYTMRDSTVKATWENVSDTRMSTKIANEKGAEVVTVEHILSALYASGITNALIEIDNSEVPILDGSSLEYIQAFKSAGISLQTLHAKVLEIVDPIRVESAHGSFIALYPSHKRTISVTYEGLQSLAGQAWTVDFDMDQDSFHDFISYARTFGFYEDAEKVWALGYAKGTSLENSVIIDNQGTIMNQNGLRSDDEFVRHKILDLIGDLALSGLIIKGSIIAKNPGHDLNNSLVRKILAKN